MKKCLILGSLLLSLTACAGGGNAPAETEAPSGVNTADMSAEVKPEVKPAAEPDVEPVSDPNVEAEDAVKIVHGEISEVIGNAVIIKEMEMPKMEAFDFSGRMPEIRLPNGEVIPMGEDGRPDFSGIDLPEGMTVNGDAAEGGKFHPGGEGERPEGEKPEGVSTEQRPEGERPARERHYTGEEVEVLLPVGIPILTHTMGENGPEETELALTALKAGDLITVTYKEDGISIESIVVSQGGMFMPGGMTFTPGDNGAFYISIGEPEAGAAAGDENVVVSVTVGEP